MTYDGKHTYFYDAENRLIQLDGTLGTCSSATECYSYDTAGRRTEKIAGSTWLDRVVDLSGNPIVIYNSSGSQAAYISFRGSFIAQYSANTTYFVQVDHVGTTRLMTNVSGGVFDSRDYLPFGEQIAGSGGQYGLKFNGKERDLESGLDNFGARYYDSNYGRFMTPDWAARPTAVPYALFGDPQSLNLYTYVRNDPVSRADADGHLPENVVEPNGTDFTSGDAYQAYVEASDAAMEGTSPGELQRETAQQTAAQIKEAVVFSDNANPQANQDKPGVLADRTVDYQAAKMDQNGNIDSHDIERHADLTLHEKLDPNSKSKNVNIANVPNTSKGIYKDYQEVLTGQSYRVLRDWKVDGNAARVLDVTTHKAYNYELTTFDANNKTPIKTEYTNVPPF